MALQQRLSGTNLQAYEDALAAVKTRVYIEGFIQTFVGSRVLRSSRTLRSHVGHSVARAVQCTGLRRGGDAATCNQVVDAKDGAKSAERSRISPPKIDDADE